MADNPNDGTNQPGPTLPPETLILDRRIEVALDKRGLGQRGPSTSDAHGGGGGGSGGSGVEARIAQLEVHVEYIKRDVAELRVDARETRDSIHSINTQITTLGQTVARLPNKGFIVKAVLTTLAVIAALITFQEQVRTFLHVP